MKPADPAPDAALPAEQAARQQALLQAMPVVFVLIWSTGFIVARYGMPHAGPATFLALRFLLSVLAFALWIAWSRPAWPQQPAQWRHLAIAGVLMHAGYLGGVWAAVKGGLGAGLAALIVGLQPVLTALWVSASAAGGGGARATAQGGPAASAPVQETQAHVSLRQWIGLGFGLAGLVLVVWHKLGVGEARPSTVAMAVAALLSITVGTLYQKRHVAPCDVRTANCIQLGAAFVVTAPLAWLEGFAWVSHPQLWGAMAWSVGVLTLGGSSLLYLLIQRGAATAVVSLLYLVPPCTAVMAWLLFGESMAPSVWAGFVLAAVGVALVVRK